MSDAGFVARSLVGHSVRASRPTLLYRLRYLWPRNERALCERLHAAVAAGLLDPFEALESYKREVWLVQNEAARALLLLPNLGLHPIVAFIWTAELRNLRERISLILGGTK